MAFDKSRFFSRRKKPVRIVLPDSDDELFVYPASSGKVVEALDALRASGDEQSAVRNLAFTLDLIVACVCDENGNQIFDAADVQELKNRPREELEPIITAVLKANGMTGEVVEPGKVSATGQTSASPSDLH